MSPLTYKMFNLYFSIWCGTYITHTYTQQQPSRKYTTHDAQNQQPLSHSIPPPEEYVATKTEGFMIRHYFYSATTDHKYNTFLWSNPHTMKREWEVVGEKKEVEKLKWVFYKDEGSIYSLLSLNMVIALGELLFWHLLFPWNTWKWPKTPQR